MIIVSIYDDLQLKQLNNYDGAILMLKKYSPLGNITNIPSAINYLKENNKKIILGLNKIYLPSDILEFKEFIKDYINTDYYYYISDFGILNILKSYNLDNNIIFNPETMICNSMDVKMYEGFNLDSIALSLEITLDSLKSILNNKNISFFYQVFGYRLMFYSLRSLISLYSEKINKKIPLENNYLKEETRDEMYPIVENKNGTFIYRSYIISYFNELNDLNLKYHYIETKFIDNDILNNIILQFKNKLNNPNLEFINPNLDIKDGFKYNDSVYVKGELK